MKLNVRKLFAVLVVSAFLAASFIQIPVVYSTDFSAIDELLLFLKSVLMLDINSYEVNVVSDLVNHPPNLGGLAEESGKVILTTGGSTLSVIFSFVNNKLVRCSIRSMEGEPLYSQYPPADTLEVYRDFLDKYQNYTGDSAVQEMRDAMDTVTEFKSATSTVGNIKITMLDNINSAVTSAVFWTYSVNGADYTSLQVGFHNSQEFFDLRDDRSYYKIGDTTVNLTSEQAISIASKRLENYSWTVDQGNGTYKEISDFQTAWQDARLLTKSKTEPRVWYPYWLVTFYLDKVYPGGVVNIIVEMWAEDGEIIDIYPLTGGGIGMPENSASPISSATPEPTPPSEPNPSVSSTTPPPTQHPTNSPLASSPQPAENPENSAFFDVGLFVVVAGAVTVGVVVSVFVIRRKVK